MHREILNFLKMNDVEYKEGFCLAEISPIKIGPKAFAVAYPKSFDELILLANFLNDYQIKYKILGRMSNVLFLDDFYDGIVIRTDRLNNFSVNQKELDASCGTSLPCLCNILCKAGLSGLEGLSGIPSSLGGALFGNAGAFGYEISNRVLDVVCYDEKTHEIITLLKDSIEFSYRRSLFKSSDYVILSARFLLSQSDEITIRNEMERCRKARFSSQPIDKPSLGSTFKRPKDGGFAASLIDGCGLKGYSVGGAQISTKHAGFIINNGGATAKDYVDLSNYVADRVYEKHKIRLEREIEII